ncbi:MAG: LLM class flavin-dependent oxidoreductase [Clostridiales bacterium]|nr:LLM class flavin-dependent oxidoreductase [Clostridiales bacterium]
MGDEKQIKSVKDEVKGHIALSGWRMGEVADRLSERKSKVALQNLSNKLAKGTIKYSEVKKIAEIIGYEIEWKKK